MRACPLVPSPGHWSLLGPWAGGGSQRAVPQPPALTSLPARSGGSGPRLCGLPLGPSANLAGAESTLGFLEGREGLFAGGHLVISAFHRTLPLLLFALPLLG